MRPLALIGFMGAGKTTVGRGVARLRGAAFTDLDEALAASFGMSVAQIFQDRGEVEFRRAERELIAASLSGDRVMALGGGAVMDELTWRRLKEDALTVWLDAPFHVLWDRIAADPGRPLLAGRNQAQVEALLETRRSRYREADHRVDADRPVSEVVEEVARLWSG